MRRPALILLFAMFVAAPFLRVTGEEPPPAAPAPPVTPAPPAPVTAAPAAAGPVDAGDPQAQFQLADGLLRRRFLDMAETEFRTFLEHYADHALAPAASYGLIQCLRGQDRNDEAVARIQAFRTRWPQDPLGRRLTLIQGDILLQKQQDADAAQCFKALLEDADIGTREAAEYFLAQCQEKLGDAPTAAATFARLAGSPFVPESPYRAYAALAAAAGREGTDAAAAAALFDRLGQEPNVPADVRDEALFRRTRLAFAAKDWEATIARGGRLIALAPTSAFAAPVARLRVRAAIEASRPDQALALIKEWRQIQPAPDPELDYLEGAALLTKEDFAAALACFDRVTAASEGRPEYLRMALHGRIGCLLRLGRYAEVAAPAQDFLTRYPDDEHVPDILYFQGVASQEAGQLEAAATALNRALAATAARRDWPHFDDACIRLASAYEKTGKLREAAASYHKLAAGKDADTAVRLLLQAAEWLQRGGDGDGAVAEYRVALGQAGKGTPERRIAALRLARLLSEQEKHADAEAVLKQFLDDAPDPQRPEAMLMLGFTQFRQGRSDDAIATFRALLAANPSPKLAAEVRYMLAVTLLESGKSDEALTLFTELWQLPPELRPSFTQPVLAKLQEISFQRNQFEISERIGRHLMETGTGQEAWTARLRLAETLTALGKLDEARTLLDDAIAKGKAGGDAAPTQAVVLEAWSLLGEAALTANDNGRAFHAFENSLAGSGASAQTTVRSRWGKAVILSREGRNAEALRHAISAYIIGNDTRYTPRAMLLAVELLVKQNRLPDARATWQELPRRFPAVAEQNKTQPFVQTLAQPAAP